MLIGYDAVSTGSNTGLSATVAHTCTGTDVNGVLIVHVVTNDTTDKITGVTYNGVALTRRLSQAAASTGFLGFVYTLNSPPAGTFNVVVSRSDSNLIGIISTSYKNTIATGFPDSSASNSTSSSPYSPTTTVVASDCWWYVATRSNDADGVYTMSSGVARGSIFAANIFSGDSNGIVGTGAQSTTITVSPGGETYWMMLSLAPAPDAPPPAPLPEKCRTDSTNRVSVRYSGGSTVFNGASSRIAGLTLNIPKKTHTFSIRIKPTIKLGQRAILTQAPGGFMFGLDATGFFHWIDTDAGNGNIAMKYNLGEWMELTWVANFNTNLVTLYKNGSLVATNSAATGTYIASTFTEIGRYTGGDRYFQGNMSDLKVYDIELTASQIMQLYTSGNAGVSPVGTWLLSDQPSTYIDSIGTSNGTGINTAYSTDTMTNARNATSFTGGSVFYDGVDDYAIINTGTSKFNLLNNFTVSTEVKLFPSTVGRFISKNYTGTGGWGFGITANANLWFTSYNIQDYFLTTYKVPYNTWVKVAAVFDSSNDVTFYVNGKKVGVVTGSLPCLSEPSSSISFGARVGVGPIYSEGIKGYQNNTHIFDRALSDREIIDMHTLGIVTNSLESFPMDAGAGTTFTGSTGSSALLNGAVWSRTIGTTQRRVVRSSNSTRAALRFNGSTTSVSIPHSNLIRPGRPFSVSMRIKSETTSNVILVEKDDNNGFSCQVDTGGIVKVNVGGATQTQNSENLKNKGWKELVYTFSTTGSKLYIDSILVSSTSNSTAPSYSTAPLYIGSRNGSFLFQGCIGDVRIHNKELSIDEVNDMYFNNSKPASGIVGEWLLSEGAGTIAYDTSGNNNHGTITSPVWVYNSSPRKQVCGNLIPNGDLSYIPAVNVPTTVDNRYIDGTASGSTTNIFGYKFSVSGTGSAMFDTNNIGPTGKPSIKISTLAPGSYIETRVGSNGYFDLVGPPGGIYIKPNTDYKVSFYQKTKVNSGASDSGAKIQVFRQNGNGGGSAESGTTFVNTTTDWTYKELLFTSGPAHTRGHIELRLYGHTGAGTLVMDSWFSDIQWRKVE
jgi:Concanavalin A-like lectin/glucanases superfamily